MPRPPLFIVLTLLAAAPVAAQDEPVEIPPSRTGLDAQLFYAVYENEGPGFEATMRAANGISYPIFLIAVPASGAYDYLSDTNVGLTGRLLAAELASLGTVFLAKNLIRRARPYVALPDVQTRQRRAPGGIDPFSFPSGHATMAFTLATATSLTYPQWYVIVPAYAWASATALARVWHGMHFPTDIAVGAALGTGIAGLVHVLLDDDDAAEEGAAVPVVSFRIPLGP